MRYNVFGEAHYPKHSEDFRFDADSYYATGDPEDLVGLIREKMLQHQKATSLTVHLTKAENV